MQIETYPQCRSIIGTSRQLFKYWNYLRPTISYGRIRDMWNIIRQLGTELSDHRFGCQEPLEKLKQDTW